MTIVRKPIICPTCDKDWCECNPPQEPIKTPRQPTLHDELVMRAEKWLKSQGCKIVIRDPFRCTNNENPDAIGWRSNISILIEVKASRSDFLADKKKMFRQLPSGGMGDWRFYLTPPEIVGPEDLPEGWGLLWVEGKRIRKVHGAPKGNTTWYSHAPFRANLQAENTMLQSALRRLTLRGHLPEIYEGLK